MKKIIVIPAFNEEKRIGGLLQELKKTNYPIIVVDDGSKDQTAAVAEKYTDYVLRHSVNLGKGAALKTGIEAAFLKSAEAIIIMDADGQHAVSDLSLFVEKLDQGYAAVIGSRGFAGDIPLVRFLGNKFASVLINILFGIYVSDLLCGFRAFTKEAYKKIKWDSPGYGIETEMIARMGKNKIKFCEVPVKTIYFDKYKGVTMIDALYLLGHVLYWRISI